MAVLSQSQLADPSMFVLKLVQWAVAAQPSRVDVEWAAGQLVVRHDGQPNSKRHLATAYCGAKAAGATQIEVEPQQVRVGGLEKLRSWKAAPLLSLGGHLGWAGALTAYLSYIHAETFFFWFAGIYLVSLCVQGAGELLRQTNPIAHHLRARCPYPPQALYFNGKPVNRPFFAIVSNYQEEPGMLDVRPRVAPDRFPTRALAESGCRLPGPAEGPPLPHLRLWGKPVTGCRCLLYRDGPGKSGWAPARAEWVQDGVVVESSPLPGVLEGIIAIVDAHDLEVDLSEFRLVRDATFERIVERIRGVALEFPWKRTG